jgi:hypothetical protein
LGEALGPQLAEVDGRGYGLRDEEGLGLGLKLGCQEPVGLGLGFVEGVGAIEELDSSGVGKIVAQPL